MSTGEQSLAKLTASNWREILSIKNDFIESQNGILVFEHKGAEGKYRLEQSTDMLTLDAKIVEEGSIKYSPLLIQKGNEVKNGITLNDAKNVELALQIIVEKQRETQNQI